MERQKRYSQQIFRQPGTVKAAADGLEKISEIESGIRNEKISHECHPTRIHAGAVACSLVAIQPTFARNHRARRARERSLARACLAQASQRLVVS